MNGCISTDQIEIFEDKPFTNIDLGPDKTIYQEESVDITVLNGGTGNYIWTPGNSLSCTNCQSTIANPLQTTTYFVSYTNVELCTSFDTLTVFVIPVSEIYFPTAFSPNGDGINDIYAALSDSVKVFELNIYNRWGELVFTSNDLSIGWDGFFKGTEQPLDTYVYVAHATLYNNKKKNYKGILTLLR